MSFRFTDEHLQSYHTLGFTIFREILPTSLLTDLRREADKAREIARRVYNVNAQRLQPVTKYADELDMRPFGDYSNLPELRDAVSRVLPFEHWWGVNDEHESGLGILIEPGGDPYCTAWHRDWRDNVQGVPLAEWEPKLTDIRYFNQVNCALYDDGCTWIVPGSHMRKDLPAEFAAMPKRPVTGPTIEGRSAAERERLCLDYCRSMPGSMQVRLNAGDFMLYRNSLWHLGNYVPYAKRATLHDYMDTPEFNAWRQRIAPICAERVKAGQPWELSSPLGVATAA